MSVQLTWANQEATRGRPYGGHVASPGRDTCQVDLAFFSVRLDQYGGDTCHHSQGDTWQADVSMMTWQLTRQVTGLYGRDTWQHGRETGGVRRADVAHTWANDRPTRGTFRLVFKGATWPSQGLPRGTPLLVRWFMC
jgi:hypothetical protein